MGRGEFSMVARQRAESSGRGSIDKLWLRLI
jgi:hypothetical protein